MLLWSIVNLYGEYGFGVADLCFLFLGEGNNGHIYMYICPFPM